MPNSYDLRVCPGNFAVARLPHNSPLPSWIGGSWYSVTRTPAELSVVCESGLIPEGVKVESAWRLIELAGPLEFSETGVLASIAAPLADHSISIFVVSTFNTDYILVSEACIGEAIEALKGAGHRVET